MTDTLTQEDVELHTGIDPDKLAHYVKRKHIINSVVGGFELEALCGHRFVQKQDPNKLPICRPCKEIYNDPKALASIMQYL